MVMPAWRSRGIDRAVFDGFRVERNVRHMRAVEGCEFVVFTTTPGQSQVQFYVGSARTHQQACVARVEFVTLRDIFQCDVQFFGVQFVRNMAFAPHNAWRLFQLVHKTNFAVHGTKDEVTEIQR